MSAGPLSPAAAGRAIGDFAMYWSGAEAAFLALDPDLQDNDRTTWVRAYRAVDRAEHPHIWQLREELPDVTDDAIFETVLSLVVGGLLQIAPNPCGCRRPEPQPVEIDRL